MKDWTGSKSSVFCTIGADGHGDAINREKNDYYATDPKAVGLLLEQEKFSDTIWECACGEGHISKALVDNGYKVVSTDLIDRGFGIGGVDFLKCNEINRYDIITNPPYRYAKEFVEQALNISEDGVKIAMFLKLTFLESKSRKELFLNNPPKFLYVSCSRLQCAKNGEFGSYGKQSATAYGWYVWEKGYKDDTKIRWIN